MKILITGARGFIGKNLVAHLGVRCDVAVVPIHRDASPEDLVRGASSADVVCHLAGVNRPDDVGEFKRGNTEYTRTLCEQIERTGRGVPIIFMSSTQAAHDNPYGASKRAAEQILVDYAARTGASIFIFRLPNVFGKWCRPNYNSVVATFCHNVARGLPIEIYNAAAPLQLVYVDDVVATIARILAGERGGDPYCDVAPTYMATVGGVADQIRAFRESRQTLLIDRVGAGLVRALYATYVSYLPTDSFAYDLVMRGDARGVFVEMLKTRDSGQFSCFTAHPGVTRGGHYHHSKTEKFLVVAGRARFRFRHILSNERHEIETSSDRLQVVEMVPGWTHDVTNIGDSELIVVLWANEVLDRDRPDTYMCAV